MKRIFALFLSALLLALAACSSAPVQNEPDPKPVEEKSPVVGQYYLGQEYTRSTFIKSTVTLYFAEDMTIQVVDSGLEMDGDDRISHYGAYTTTGNSVTIKIGSEEYTGVVRDEGETLIIGSTELSRTTLDGLSAKTRAAFE